MSINDIDRQTMKNTKLLKVNKLSELMMNLREIILSVSLVMCDTESLITEARKSMNAYKNEVESEKKSVCYFIDFHYLLLPLIIFFLLKSNSVTSVVIDSLFCQL